MALCPLLDGRRAARCGCPCRCPSKGPGAPQCPEEAPALEKALSIQTWTEISVNEILPVAFAAHAFLMGSGCCLLPLPYPSGAEALRPSPDGGGLGADFSNWAHRGWKSSRLLFPFESINPAAPGPLSLLSRVSSTE